MPPARSASKASEPMKQAKLSFTSKRTASTTAGKSSKATRKQPARAASTPSAKDTIIISESSEEEDDVPTAKRRRVVVEQEDEAPRLTARMQAAKRAVEEVVEKEPLDVSDKRWRKLYGQARNKMGDIQPVHAKDESMVDHILRVFDLSYEYGPCVGVSRLDRWERAEALGLNPPPEIKEILLSKEGSAEDRYSQSVFFGEV